MTGRPGRGASIGLLARGEDGLEAARAEVEALGGNALVLPTGVSDHAHLLCGYPMALAHAQQGESISAAHWFERSRTACGPPGLFAEEYDVAQRQLRGNLPQAFVHALLLECAHDERLS